MAERGVAVLGATGSIGTQTLDVLRKGLEGFRVKVLTGYKNTAQLASLANEFNPEAVWVPDGAAADSLRLALNVPSSIFTGPDGLRHCVQLESVGLVVNAITGQAGLAPAFAAVRAGKDIALANKETMVTAGPLFMREAQEAGVVLSLIDSEHSAIVQCLNGNENNVIEKIYLTASGGPFRGWPAEKITHAKAADALRHPTWNMGPKITIDCATMMNKGLEFIEAVYLYGLRPGQVEVVVHPQSIVHSMVQFMDGSVMAQLSANDMRLPIQYALTGPERKPNLFPRMDLLALKNLTFEPPDTDKFPCLRLAMEAVRHGGLLPAVMNRVNELAVGAYLRDKISFYTISGLIAEALGTYTNKTLARLEDVWEAERWAEDFFRSKVY